MLVRYFLFFSLNLLPTQIHIELGGFLLLQFVSTFSISMPLYARGRHTDTHNVMIPSVESECNSYDRFEDIGYYHEKKKKNISKKYIFAIYSSLQLVASCRKTRKKFVATHCHSTISKNGTSQCHDAMYCSCASLSIQSSDAGKKALDQQQMTKTENVFISSATDHLLETRVGERVRDTRYIPNMKWSIDQSKLAIRYILDTHAKRPGDQR